MSIAVTLYRQRFWLVVLLGVVTLGLLFFQLPSSNDAFVPPTGSAPDHNGHLTQQPGKLLEQHINNLGFSNNEAEYFVQHTLQKHRVVVFSKTSCPEALAAKAVLEKYRRQHGLSDYFVVEVDLQEEPEHVKQALIKMHGRSTFPSVFLDGVPVGGNDDIQRLEKLENLGPMLSQKGLLRDSIDDIASTFITETVNNNTVAVFTTKTAVDKETMEVFAELQKVYNFTLTKVVIDEKPHNFFAMRQRLFKMSGKQNFPLTYMFRTAWGGQPGDIPYFKKHGDLVESFQKNRVPLLGTPEAEKEEPVKPNPAVDGFPEATTLQGREFVDAFVKKFDVAVLGKNAILHSRALWDLLHQYELNYGLKFKWIDVDQRNDEKEIQKALKDTSGRDNFPNLFVNGVSLGGSDEVYAKNVAGELRDFFVVSGIIENAKVTEHEQVVRDKVKDEITKTPLMVYVRSFDSDSLKVKAIIDGYKELYQLDYGYVKVEEQADSTEYMLALKDLYGVTSLPAIFVNGKEVGGLAGLRVMYDAGTLKEELVNAKVIAQDEYDREKAKMSNLIKDMKEADVKEDPSWTPEEKKVRQLIKRNRVMVFSKTTCSFSRRAKTLLGQYRDQRGLEYEVLEADLESNVAAVKAALVSVSGRSTFPNIFVDGKSIGGSDELLEKHVKGDLEELFQKKNLIV
ncbi:hypothetical protein FBU59_000178 [Linderina macrospora]|uniref:Uncharacterized protein n=1 Tax=Linderina macrospora TaxID=4868 RepID=A0ACC1JHV5_9FUNG|nr:hypothetical protein FBU59_000178 [Linderina macrospora]